MKFLSWAQVLQHVVYPVLKMQCPFTSNINIIISVLIKAMFQLNFTYKSLKLYFAFQYSRTCIKRPPKGRMENGLLMKVVF